MTDTADGSGFKVLLCDCEGTNPLPDKTIATASGQAPMLCGSQLCRAQIENFERHLKGEGPLLVGCTQEAPLFLEVAEAAGFAGDLRFVNIREKAGWSRQHDRAGAKMGALIAEAMASVDGPQTVSLTSQGVVLVLGRDSAALAAAKRLAARMDVTLVLERADEMIPPRSAEVPVFFGRARGARGHLGSFEVEIDDYAAPVPSARDALIFETPTSERSLSRCDIVLDLRGEAALVPAPEKRDGYFRPDPRDPAAVAEALFEIVDLVGTFEKPRYVEYDAALCAHGRSGIVGCSRCLDNCPTGAIVSDGDTVAIDPFICAGCGTCAGVCPTGAAVYAMPRNAALLSRLRTLIAAFAAGGGRHPVLLFHDGEHGEDMIDAVARHYDGLPADVLPVALNAVAQLGLEAMLAARAFGARRSLVLAPPRDAEELAGLRETAILANHIFDGLGYKDGQVDVLMEQDPEVLAATLGALPRADGGAPAVKDFVPVGGKRPLLDLTLAALHAGAPNPLDTLALPAGAPFGSLEIDVEGCTLCLACVGACPANALRDNPDFPRLSFLESACVQCGLCVKTCPEKVIRLTPRLDFTGAARNPRTIKEDQPFHCIRCGNAFGTTSLIESVVERMSGHAMFADEAALRRLRMCADCRVVDMAETQAEPMAGAPRPRTRTTEDYLRARAAGDPDDDDPDA